MHFKLNHFHNLMVLETVNFDRVFYICKLGLFINHSYQQRSHHYMFHKFLSGFGVACIFMLITTTIDTRIDKIFEKARPHPSQMNQTISGLYLIEPECATVCLFVAA
jgi:hypothetical protein